MNLLRRTPHPLILEIPARSWLRALAEDAGGTITLADVPDAVLREIASRGFHGIWLMGVWHTGAAARDLALRIPELGREYTRVLPDWRPDDVDGSPYAIAEYSVAASLGGDDALAAFRDRLRARGLGLVLDFVPNHLACDHRWLDDHPDRFVRGALSDVEREPENWFVHTTPGGEERVFAHGRDPYFAGWTDTVQLDYRRPETREVMTSQLIDVAARCDGMRCDMAMLVLEDVFGSTWGGFSGSGDFWSEAIPALRRDHPESTLIAEVYWELEDRLCERGFDFAYDKELYDRLVAVDVPGVRDVVARPVAHHATRVRFLENHDEPRAAETLGPRLFAAAAVTYSLPGLRFFFEGQVEGRRVRTPVQLGRAPREPEVAEIRGFYDRLLALLGRDALHRGAWSPVEVDAAGEHAAAALVGSRWSGADETVLVVANLGDRDATASIPLDRPGGAEDSVRIEDLTSGDGFERNRRELREVGLELTVPAYDVRFMRAV
jgi:hypothetical protein